MDKSKKDKIKVGTVALIGRPNAGKSTLVNNLVGHKVSITSPKPQTTQFPIYAVYEDFRGQIIFVDTPGIFAKTKDLRSKEVNLVAEKILTEEIDAVLYLVDMTRERGDEENRVLGALRKLKVPKILIINKIDIKEPDYSAQYRFLEDEFDVILKVSALRPLNIGSIPDALFDILPEGEQIVERADLPIPALNLTSTMHMQELIREKAFLTLRKELPYHISVVVESIEERNNGSMYVKAHVVTEPRYKKMVIGTGGEKIKQIGMMTRKELEISTGKKFYVELTVEVEK